MGQKLHLGMPTVVESSADRTPFGAIFEDDGKVAYFYGLDRRLGDSPIVDSVYVYHVKAILDHPTDDLDVYVPCDVDIVWSPDQQRVALVLNGRAQAAFDFEAKRAYCRSNFPMSSQWSSGGHAWDDRAVDFLESRS
jgi:hypothetical protein